MAFLAAHDARLSQREPRWRILMQVRLAALIFGLLSGMMFALCGHFYTGVQWASESQYMGSSIGYSLFGSGLGLSVLANLAYFIMLCVKSHYLLPAGANVGIDCVVWTMMLSMGIVGSMLLNYKPASVYCPEYYADINYRSGNGWCTKNWDLVKASERGGMVFFFLCLIAQFGLFVQACRRVDKNRKARKAARRLQRAIDEATEEK